MSCPELPEAHKSTYLSGFPAASIVAESPLWGRFWEQEALSDIQRRLLEHPREEVSRELLAFGKSGTTYLGWVHTRKGERVATELTSQLIDLAVAAANDYLKSVSAV